VWCQNTTDWRYSYLAGDYLLVGLDLFVGVEWWEAGGHLVDEHAERPPVHRVVVALSTPHDHIITVIYISIIAVKERRRVS